ncbi:MAG: phosphohistidine phosphatase SixA [Acidobacteria bacterium]|nr:phosphohistidine phosphatase SixA [Acidobacteriota bacterium]
MQLYLVQHGAAKTEAEDPQRGLTDDGRRRVERMAEFLAPLELALDRIEHSGKLRARQTAEILAAQLHPRKGIVEVAGLAPNDDIEPVRLRLERESKNLPAGRRGLMLVGHLPHLSRLASRLLGHEAGRAVVQFQMGGVVRLDQDEAGRWVLCWALVPELLSKG